MRFTKPAALLSSMLLVGCAKPLVIHEPVEVQVIKYEPVPVPEALLTPCRIELKLETNQDLELALAAALLELRRCTEDKDAIRELK